MMQRKFLTYAAIMVALALLASCGSSRKAAAPAKTATEYTPKAPDQKEQKQKVEASARELNKQGKALLKEAETWLGVPYLYGGNDRNGIDCSGFVLQVYLKALNVKLPRSSAEMSDFCTNKVKRDKLQPGDLVFFDTSKARNGKVSHVGLYVGDGNMIHASTSKGVIVTSIDSNYYAGRLLSGGRVRDFMSEQKAQKPQKTEKPAPVVIPTDTVVPDAKPVTPEPKLAEKTEKTEPEKTEPEKKASKKPEPKPAASETAKSEPAKPAQTARNDKPLSDRDIVMGRLIEEKLDSIYEKR